MHTISWLLFNEPIYFIIIDFWWFLLGWLNRFCLHSCKRLIWFYIFRLEFFSFNFCYLHLCLKANKFYLTVNAAHFELFMCWLENQLNCVPNRNITALNYNFFFFEVLVQSKAKKMLQSLIKSCNNSNHNYLLVFVSVCLLVNLFSNYTTQYGLSV